MLGKRKWNLLLALLLAAGLLLCLTAMVSAQDDEPTAAAADEDTATELDTAGDEEQEETGLQRNLWVLIGLCGMFGGLLFGMKDQNLYLPYRHSKRVIKPGFLVDLLFGLAGGIVIFFIMPIELFDVTQSFGLVRLLGIAMIGGYGGRALIEQVLDQQLKKLKEDMEQLEEQTEESASQVKEIKAQERTGATVAALLDQYLDEEREKPLQPEESKELMEAISKASASTRVYAFTQARAFRKKVSKKEETRHLIAKVIPVFEKLILADTENRYHRNHSQLAYALKDQPKADYERAAAELTTAIQIRDEQKIDGFKIYEFSRAMCRIHLGRPTSEIVADLQEAATDPIIREWIQRPDPKRAQELIDWIEQNQDELPAWMVGKS